MQEVDAILCTKTEINKRSAGLGEREVKQGLRGGRTLMAQFKGGDVTVDGLFGDARVTSQFTWLAQSA